MDVIDYSAPRRVLTVARGHPYDRQAFADLFAGLDGFDVCQVEHPAARDCLGPQACERYAAIVCYDMPGVDFTAGAESPRMVPPEADFAGAYLAMLRTGIGMVYLHHALAAWPAWPEYAEILGGRFHYRPAVLREREWPDSGYRHGVTHQVSVLRDHPVTQGVPQQFEITDELYLCPVFESEVVPLLSSNHGFSDSHFYSAAQAVAGDMQSRKGWTHPQGSSLVGWASSWGNSPLVYLQGGDDASALGNRHFRRLVHNAVRWVSSASAHAWARQRAAARE